MSGGKWAPRYRYTVYNNRTDMPVIVDGTADEAAEAMGITKNVFYGYIGRSKRGIVSKWTIERREAPKKQPQEITINKAVQMLYAVYGKAKRTKFVRDPLAYALYQVWKVVDETNDR